MGLIFQVMLWAMIGLLTAAGLYSWLSGEPSGGKVVELLVRTYLLAIPTALILFSIVMAFRRVVPLAISGGILSLLWLVFSWVG